MSWSVAVIAVGTEITEGDVLNRNASWLSQYVSERGGVVLRHLAVPDDEGQMALAFEENMSGVDLVLVTGGLGPTSDDFTRKVISRVLKRPLQFSEPSWQRLCQRLRERGVPVRDSHRQECEFPDGALELANSAGTASGFLLETEKDGANTVWVVLPGPPREVQAVMVEQAWPEISRRRPRWDRSRCRLTARWFAVPESEIAQRASSILVGAGRQIGYRAHFPFVDVKVWVATPDDLIGVRSDLTVLRDSLDAASWVGFDATDEAERILERMSLSHPEGARLEVVDSASAGRLASRLMMASLGRKVRVFNLESEPGTGLGRNDGGAASRLADSTCRLSLARASAAPDQVRFLLQWKFGSRSGQAELDMAASRRRLDELACEWALWRVADEVHL
jgi:molybdenum cofactor synthesis domain-containing protein